MTRGSYSNERIKDLAGGLNLEFSPNEIDNKQCVVSENFNFKGNKLINSQGSALYADFGNFPIVAVEEIDNNVWVMYDDTNIKLGRIGTDGAGNVSTSKFLNNSYFFYIDTISIPSTYTINTVSVVNGTFSYTTVGGDTVATVYNALASAINANAYVGAEVDYGKLEGASSSIQGLFLYPKTSDGFTATETGGGTLVESQVIPFENAVSILKNGNDIITGGKDYPVTYWKRVGTNYEAYWGQFIKMSGGAYIRSNIITTYEGKLIVANPGTNQLQHSRTSGIDDESLVTVFDAYDGGAQYVGGDGAITALLTGQNGVYAFKEDEIYYADTVEDTGVSFDYNFRRITNNGAKDKYCVTRVSQDIFYYDGINKKIRRLSYEENYEGLRDNAISDEIDELLFAQKASYGIQQKLYYSYPNVRFACQNASASGSLNNTIYVYNVDTKSWTVETNKAVKYAYGRYFTKEGVNGKVYIDNVSFESSGQWLSKEYDLGEAIDWKRFGEIEVYGKNTSDITLYMDVYVDGALIKTFTITNNYGDYFRRRFDIWNRGRYFQFKFRYSGVGYIEINEVNFQWKLLKAYKYN